MPSKSRRPRARPAPRRSSLRDPRTHDERARRAVRKFRQMIPMLNAYLRVVSGNPKLRIQVSHENGASTRNVIYFMPPIQLGDDLVHDEMLCNERGTDGIQLCNACRVHEHLMAVMYHEIGHIAFGTHAEPKAGQLRIAKRMAADWIKPKIGLLSEQELMRRYDGAGEKTYMALANCLYPHMGILFNCTEDARVNEAVFRVRRGVRYMYNALMAEVVRDGIPNPSEPDVRISWKEMGLEMQMCLAVTCQLQGILERYDDLFAEQIYADLANEMLQKHLANWTADFDVWDNFLFTVALMKILNAMGYLLVPETDEEGDKGEGSSSGGEGDSEGSESESESGSGSGSSSDSKSGNKDESDGSAGSSSDDSESEDKDEDDGSSEGDSEAESEGDSGDGDDASSDATPGSAEDRARPGGNLKEIKVCIGEQLEPQAFGPKPPEAESDSDDEEAAREAERTKRAINEALEDAFRKAIEQVEHFEAPSREIRGVRFIKPGEYRWWNDETVEPEYSQAALNNSVMHGRLTFQDNRRHRKVNNLRRGKVAPNALAKRAPLDDDRLFSKQVIPGKRDYHVVIGMDLSGSTSGSNIYLERNAVFTQAELLHRIGVSFEIWGHTGDDDLMLFTIKTREQAWDKQAQERLMSVNACSANLDGHALEFLRKRADEAHATEKIIMYYSDGAMPMENYVEELEILQREILTCRRKRIVLVGVGIRTDAPTEHGLDTVQINSPDDLPKVLKHLEKYLLRKVA